MMRLTPAYLPLVATGSPGPARGRARPRVPDAIQVATAVDLFLTDAFASSYDVSLPPRVPRRLCA